MKDQNLFLPNAPSPLQPAPHLPHRGRLRTGVQLSREDVEKRTGVNEGTLYRIETARSRPQKRTLMALLDLYQADDALRQDLLTIARTADDQGWLRPYHAELPEEYAVYISFEAEATAVRNYESLYIPACSRPRITLALPSAAPTRRSHTLQSSSVSRLGSNARNA